MRIDASNLIAAQATPVQRPKPAVHKLPEEAKPIFEPIDFSNAGKEVDSAAPALPKSEPKPHNVTHIDQKPTRHAQGGQDQRPGSYVDIKV